MPYQKSFFAQLENVLISVTKTTQAYLLHSVFERSTAKDTDSDNRSARRVVYIFLRLNTVPCHTDSATEKNIGHITWNMFHASILISIALI